MSLGLDQHIILAKDLDGTENKTNLGANAILGAVDSERVGRKTTVWYDWGFSKIVILPCKITGWHVCHLGWMFCAHKAVTIHPAVLEYFSGWKCTPSNWWFQLYPIWPARFFFEVGGKNKHQVVLYLPLGLSQTKMFWTSPNKMCFHWFDWYKRTLPVNMIMIFPAIGSMYGHVGLGYHWDTTNIHYLTCFFNMYHSSQFADFIDHPSERRFLGLARLSPLTHLKTTSGRNHH